MKTTIFLCIAFMTSGFAIIKDQEVKTNDDLRERKLNLLEMLEAGKPIESKEIRASFGNGNENDFGLVEECPVLFSQYELQKLNETVRCNMELIKREISCWKNSEEFKKAMDEIRKGSEEIRRELEKMREEFRMSDRRSAEWENG